MFLYFLPCHMQCWAVSSWWPIFRPYSSKCSSVLNYQCWLLNMCVVVFKPYKSWSIYGYAHCIPLCPLHSMWSITCVLIESIQCILDCMDPFVQDANMGIPDKWSSPSTHFFPPVWGWVTIKWHLYIKYRYYSCKYARPSVKPGNTHSAFSQWSTHPQMLSDPPFAHTCTY